MSVYFIENKEEIPLLTSEDRINANLPLIVVELINDQSSNVLSLKVRNISYLWFKAEEMYFKLKTQTNNPMLVVNATLFELNYNLEIKKSISDYYNNNIEIVNINEYMCDFKSSVV